VRIPQPGGFAAALDNEFELWVAFRELVLRITSRWPQPERWNQDVDDFVAELRQSVSLNNGVSAWLAVVLCRCSLEAVDRVPRMTRIVHALGGSKIGLTPADDARTKALVSNSLKFCRENFPQSVQKMLLPSQEDESDAKLQPREERAPPSPRRSPKPKESKSKPNESAAEPQGVAPKASKRASGAQRRKARRLKLHEVVKELQKLDVDSDGAVKIAK
jgi:hypothetical protein